MGPRATEQRGVAMSLHEIVAQGDRAASLRAIRDNLAKQLEESIPAYAAALAHQLTDVIRELDSLPASESTDHVDDLEMARDARRAAARASAAAH